MDTFLKKYNLPQLIQENTENLNHPVSNKEVEFVTQNSSRKKSPDPDSFTGKCYYTFKDKQNTSFSQTSSASRAAGKHC